MEEIKNTQELFKMPKEQAVDIIEKTLKKDNYYLETNGSIREIAIAAYPVINFYLTFDNEWPMHTKYEKIYFLPNKKDIENHGEFFAKIKYAASFVTEYTANRENKFLSVSKMKNIGLMLYCTMSSKDRTVDEKIHYKKQHTILDGEIAIRTMLQVDVNLQKTVEEFNIIEL